MSKHNIESKEDKKIRKAEKKKKKEKKREKKHNKRESTESARSSQSTAQVEKQVKRLDHDSDDDYSIYSLDDANSPFQKKKVSVMLSLMPSAMTNSHKAMNSAMQTMLLKYSDSLGGVLLSYENIEIDETKNGGRFGRILNEMPHIHYYVTCDVLVFNPSVGSTLVGVVNETFPSHVGLLVHELFNAMISAESLRQNGFLFDADTNEWSKQDTMVPISIGDGIKFTVEKVHECNGLISLESKDPVIVQ
jgi:DNA-directed RNA polymerase I subunit RPA43